MKKDCSFCKLLLNLVKRNILEGNVKEAQEKLKIYYKHIITHKNKY